VTMVVLGFSRFKISCEPQVSRDSNEIAIIDDMNYYDMHAVLCFYKINVREYRREIQKGTIQRN
jgi:hypothetical protein